MKNIKNLDQNEFTIAVFETGLLPEELANRYETYPMMFANLVSREAENLKFVAISAVQGEPLPQVNQFDGYVIMGSRYGVYDKEDWIENLRTFVRAAYKAEKPIVGICFGHQIIADALGGKVEKSEKGWGLGQQNYSMKKSTSWMNPEKTETELSALMIHQDQVVELPPDAEVLGGNSFCPNGILAYKGPAISFQFHPEITPEYVADLSEVRRGGPFSDELVEDCKKSLNPENDHNLVAKWIANFFHQHFNRETKDNN